MSLFPNEEYIIRKETKHKGKKGIIGITNFRVIWISEGSAMPDLVIQYNNIKETDKIDNEEDKISYLSIKRKEFRDRPLPELLFVFSSATHAEDMQTCNDYIKTYMNQTQKHDLLYFFPASTQIKIKILENNKELHQIHKLLVQSGKMTENEFWKSSDEYRSYLQDKLHSSQVPGKLSAVIRIPHRFITNNEVVVDVLNKHKLAIFRQLPQVKYDFLHTVPHKKSEKKFWKGFWENQLFVGSAMSDALEITGEYLSVEVPAKASEQLPQNFGVFQADTKLNPIFLQIAQQINEHSFYVVSDSGPIPQTEPLILPDYQFKKVTDSAMEIDAPLPNDEHWGTYVANAFNDPIANSVYPGPAEAIEAIRQIFQQTYFNNVKDIEDHSNPCSYATKIYQVLKYFYAEFPLSQDKVQRIQTILEIAEEVFSEMKAKTTHRESIQNMEIMISIASDRLHQIKQS